MCNRLILSPKTGLFNLQALAQLILGPRILYRLMKQEYQKFPFHFNPQSFHIPVILY
jgi:hypothetical protein